jgi:hypothetical protein
MDVVPSLRIAATGVLSRRQMDVGGNKEQEVRNGHLEITNPARGKRV